MLHGIPVHLPVQADSHEQGEYESYSQQGYRHDKAQGGVGHGAAVLF